MAMKKLYITILAIVLWLPISVCGQQSVVLVGSSSVQTYKMRSVAPMRVSRAIEKQKTDIEDPNTYGIYNTSMELYTKSKIRRTTQSVVLGGSSSNGISLWTSSSHLEGVSQISGNEVGAVSLMYGLAGPGVPNVPEDEIIPLELDREVILLVLMMALGYAGILYKRSVDLEDEQS